MRISGIEYVHSILCIYIYIYMQFRYALSSMLLFSVDSCYLSILQGCFHGTGSSTGARMLKWIPDYLILPSGGFFLTNMIWNDDAMVYKLSALLALLWGESTDDKGLVMGSLDVFFGVDLNKWLNKQSVAGDFRCHKAHATSFPCLRLLIHALVPMQMKQSWEWG